jgi:hypothetical protein
MAGGILILQITPKTAVEMTDASQHQAAIVMIVLRIFLEFHHHRHSGTAGE